MAVVDMELAERSLTKAELQIFNILLGKVQDAEDREYEDRHFDTVDDDEEPFNYTPPRYEVYYTNGGEEKMNDVVFATDDEGAVLNWYQKNQLDGELVKKIKEWTYNGCPIHIERIDDNE